MRTISQLEPVGDLGRDKPFTSRCSVQRVAVRRGGDLALALGEPYVRGCRGSGDLKACLSTCPVPTACQLGFHAVRAHNGLALSAVMLQFGGADRPFSQPPYVLLNPRAVVWAVPCGFEVAHSVRRAGRGTAQVSSGFVQNALHSHHAQDVFPAFSYRSRGSTAASWPGRTPRSPSVHSEARRPLASKGPPTP